MDDLRRRLEAVERALTGGDGDLTALADGAAAADRVASLEADVAAIEDEVAELEAAAQALRGYVGNVRSVNESVEDRADAALASVESLEERVDALEARRDGGADGESWRRRPRTDPASTSGGADRPAHRTGTQACHACGRPAPNRAADGGSRPGSASEGGTGAVGEATEDSPPGSDRPSRRRETIADFDPEGSVDPVAPPGTAGETGPAGRGPANRTGPDAPEAGLLDRLRRRL